MEKYRELLSSNAFTKDFSKASENSIVNTYHLRLKLILFFQILNSLI